MKNHPGNGLVSESTLFDTIWKEGSRINRSFKEAEGGSSFMKTKKKIAAMLLAVALCMAGAVSLFAAVALPSISSSKPIACYTLKASGKVYAYSAANLRNKTGGYIDCAADECRILRISGNAVQVKYPVSNGTRTAWFPRSAFSGYNMANGAAQRWTQDRQVTTYRRADGRTSYGHISAGDTCYKLSESGNYMQVVYPVSNGYKMGWIAKNGSSGSNGQSSQGSSGQPVPNGMYKVVSMIDRQYVWDIYDASTNNGGNLQLWKDNGTNAQKFTFTYNSDGYYTITNANSNKAVDCAGGESANGTNIQQYTPNNSNAQRWKLTSVGNGYYTFQCKGNGKMIDVSGGVASSGTNIQLYQSNGSKAQKFALVKTQKKQGASNNTNKSGREAAISYMNAMATIEWTPKKSFQHWSYSSKNGHVWTAGTTYYGIPYTQKARNTSLEAFQGKLSGKVYIGPSGKNTYMGNDCSSAVSYAYRKVNSKFPILATGGMYPVDGKTKKVGKYDHKNLRNTASICTRNGKNVMKDSYSSLQPGDLLLKNPSGAHVMMVTEVGSDYVKVTHQTTYKSSLHSSWRVNERMSFDSLYNSRYIPVTMALW